MSRLVSSKCPSCGGSLQVDPEVAVASCGFCNASSFVQTSKRRAPSPRPGFVIDVDPVVSTPWLALSVMVSLVIAAGVYGWDSIERHLPASIARANQARAPARPTEVAAPPEIEQPPSAPAPSAPLEPSRSERPPAVIVPEESAPKTPTRTKRVMGSIEAGEPTISGRLDPSVIQKIVRQNHARMRGCYELGLARDARLEGPISVRFVIARNGKVSNVASGILYFPDDSVERCIHASFYGLTFPAPQSGIVTVAYPFILRPKQ